MAKPNARDTPEERALPIPLPPPPPAQSHGRHVVTERGWAMILAQRLADTSAALSDLAAVAQATQSDPHLTDEEGRLVWGDVTAPRERRVVAEPYRSTLRQVRDEIDAEFRAERPHRGLLARLGRR